MPCAYTSRSPLIYELSHLRSPLPLPLPFRPTPYLPASDLQRLLAITVKSPGKFNSSNSPSALFPIHTKEPRPPHPNSPSYISLPFFSNPILTSFCIPPNSQISHIYAHKVFRLYIWPYPSPSLHPLLLLPAATHVPISIMIGRVYG